MHFCCACCRATNRGLMRGLVIRFRLGLFVGPQFEVQRQYEDLLGKKWTSWPPTALPAWQSWRRHWRCVKNNTTFFAPDAARRAHWWNDAIASATGIVTWRHVALPFDMTDMKQSYQIFYQWNYRISYYRLYVVRRENRWQNRCARLNVYILKRFAQTKFLTQCDWLNEMSWSVDTLYAHNSCPFCDISAI